MSISDGEWTSRDDNLATIANLTRGRTVDIVTNGDPDTIRLRGYDVFHTMITDTGLQSRYGHDLHGPPPGPHAMTIAWVCNPSTEGITGRIEHLNRLGCVGIITDITFPWRHPEQVIGPPPGWLDEARIARIESNIRNAVVVTTPSEWLLDELRELNPNVVHVPDLEPGAEEAWQVATGAMLMLAMGVVAGRGHAHGRRGWWQRLARWARKAIR